MILVLLAGGTAGPAPGPGAPDPAPDRAGGGTADTGPGAAPGRSAATAHRPLPRWAWALPTCVGYRPSEYRAPTRRTGVEIRPDGAVTRQVEWYEPGWGPRAMAEIRTVLRECASYEYGAVDDPAGFREQHLVIDTDFAGDESLLVESVRQQPPDLHTRYAAVVRDGDRVTTLRSEQLGPAALRCEVRPDRQPVGRVRRDQQCAPR